jgi:tetratricopeptide (TPR) repeat protein
MPNGSKGQEKSSVFRKCYLTVLVGYRRSRQKWTKNPILRQKKANFLKPAPHYTDLKSMKTRVYTQIWIALSLISVACSTTTKPGKVVRLEENFEQKKAEEHDVPALKKTHQQLAADVERAVPVDTEDAAAFYFSLGQAYSLDNDIPRAIEAYRATLVYDPKSALVHTRLAAELVKDNRFQEARELCEKAIKIDAKYADAYLLLAGIQVSAKEFAAALATYQKTLVISPKNRDALLYYGVTLAETGNLKEAVAQLEILTKLKDSAESNIDQSVAFYYLAKVQQQANNTKAAIAALHSALQKRPNFAKAAGLLAEVYMSQGQKAKAIQVLVENFREQPQVEVAEMLANHFLTEQKYKEAVVYLETLVEEDPSNENMRMKLGLVYWQLKWLDKSYAVFKNLHERFPASDEILYYLSELEWDRKGADAALVYYKKIPAESTKYEQAIARMSQYYREEKRNKEANSLVWDAIQKRPDITSFYTLLGAYYEEDKQIEDAVAVLELGHRKFGREEAILYYLGFLYERAGKKAEAMKMMDQLLVQNPNNANALNFVGYTLLDEGKDLKKAEKYLGQAYKLKPDDAYVLDSFGWLQHKLGRHKDAMKHLEKAHSKKSQEAIIVEHLADVYIALHMQQKALAAYEKALQLWTESDAKERLATKISNVRNAIAANNITVKKWDRSPASSRAVADVPGAE